MEIILTLIKLNNGMWFSSLLRCLFIDVWIYSYEYNRRSASDMNGMDGWNVNACSLLWCRSVRTKLRRGLFARRRTAATTIRRKIECVIWYPWSSVFGLSQLRQLQKLKHLFKISRSRAPSADIFKYIKEAQLLFYQETWQVVVGKCLKCHLDLKAYLCICFSFFFFLVWEQIGL